MVRAAAEKRERESHVAKKKRKKQKSIRFLSVAEVAQNAARALVLLRQVEELLPGMEVLDKDERLHSNGRIKEGEPVVMRSVLDAVDEHPKLFEAIAPIDHGKDDRRVETQPARDDLDRREHLAVIGRAIEELATRVSDTILILGESVREVVGPAYRIGRAASDVNPEIRRALGTAISFYSGPAREVAREKKKAEKATKAERPV
jgi:hypothetical protein